MREGAYSTSNSTTRSSVPLRARKIASTLGTGVLRGRAPPPPRRSPDKRPGREGCSISNDGALGQRALSRHREPKAQRLDLDAGQRPHRQPDGADSPEGLTVVLVLDDANQRHAR